MVNVVAMSGGGIKAAVAAARYAAESLVALLHVDWGQASAASELKALRLFAERVKNVRLVTVEVRRGHPAAGSDAAVSAVRGGRSEDRGDEPSAAVSRGLVALLTGAGVQCAAQHNATKLVIGLTKPTPADDGGLPWADADDDARRAFVHTYNMMLECSLPRRADIRLEAPLITVSYAEVIRLAERFHVPLEFTWSCEHGGAAPCRRCRGCVARERAFIEARRPDPLLAALPQAHVVAH